MLTPNPLLTLPFGALLTLMALAPLWFPDWWGRHYPKICFALGALVISYYTLELQAGGRILETIQDYVRFIVLIGSLFIVAGGIHLTVKGEATPRANVVFLLVGALIANVAGTTGASMLLIRPWLRMNRYRVTAHHVVFFIFIVSNVGGCLTPIGDPPLYLGYLKGIPFWWVAEHVWPVWCAGVGMLLFAFYWIDRRNYLRAPDRIRHQLTDAGESWKIAGSSNLIFLGIILGAAFLERPPFLREALMIGAAVGSYFTTPRAVHDSNAFTFGPIREVAIIFAGIFATMLPALDWLRTNAAQIGDPSPAFYFAGSGALSSVLDNAPTYLTFLNAILGTLTDPELLGQVEHLIRTHSNGLPMINGHYSKSIQWTMAAFAQYHPAALASGNASPDQIGICFLLGNQGYHKFIVALSAGAVFFGANTYIGNGPNLMVKAIADQQKVHTPSFVAYVTRFTLPYMIPMLVVVWWIFFRT